MIRNINEAFGDSISFESVDEMEQAIEDCGYEIPSDGLKEGRDYEVVQPKSLNELFVAMKNNDESLPSWDSLPTFGGPDVENTVEVWSWDATRMIVGKCSDDIQIVPRTDTI